jgi:hypothetical protein
MEEIRMFFVGDHLDHVVICIARRLSAPRTCLEYQVVEPGNRLDLVQQAGLVNITAAHYGNCVLPALKPWNA